MSNKQNHAVAKIVFGIQDQWGLSNADLSVLLKTDEARLSDWREKLEVDPSDRVLLLINLYDSIASFIVSKEDQIALVMSRRIDHFGGKTMFETITTEDSGLNRVIEFVRRVFIP